jgi:polysaccharide export outer membrane protein
VNPAPTTSAALRPARPAAALLALCALAAPLLAGCRTSEAAYVWADRYEEPSTAGPYLIGPGDTLNVRVFNQEGMSGTARVRPDGMISLPFLNDIEAAGDTPAVLAQRIQVRLKDYLVNPVVTVSLAETRPLEISVMGEVQRPGLYRLEQGAGVLTALAAASGFSNFADKDRIFVVRNGTPRIRFTYAALSQAREKAARFRLAPGDVVVVE